MFLVSVSAAQEISRIATLEQQQPLELVFADSIVPQGRHEIMSTTGVWYSKRDALHNGALSQKLEWGISDRLQISTFINALQESNASGTGETGAGDFDIGARYTWAHLGSPYTHLAIALEAGLPTGNARRALGEGAYVVSPSVLLSRELKSGTYQLFTTVGTELIVAHRATSADDTPHHSLFANSGALRRLGHGWLVGEVSVNSTKWTGGDETEVTLTPSYIWRLARRMELLAGIPLGLTSTTDKLGGVIKFTFEFGGREE